MIEYLREIHERLDQFAVGINDAISTVSSMEKRLTEFYLPCPEWDETDYEDANKDTEA